MGDGADGGAVRGIQMEINERGALLSTVLEDGRALDLFPLTFGRVRVTVSPSVESMTWDEGW